jgi:predicted house-cleaning NTP pyrophosphatase (Maf/HAM1 superfamily)
MKKATLETIRTALTDLGYENKEVLDELDAELNKGAAEKAARAAAYEGIHSLIVDNLSDTPITCADLFVEIEPEVVAKGMTRYNVQYALNSLWQDEIVKIAGKPNTYRHA